MLENVSSKPLNNYQKRKLRLQQLEAEGKKLEGSNKSWQQEHKMCVISGCQNRKGGKVEFAGGMCMPCYKYLHFKEENNSTLHRNVLRAERDMERRGRAKK